MRAGDRTRWVTALRTFERGIIAVLVVVVAVVVVLATLDLGWRLAAHVASPPVARLEVGELLDSFGFLLLVLIGLELLDTLEAYLSENAVHVEIVLEVALIAVARKVIVLDLKKTPSGTLLGMAAVILALAVAFSLQQRARRSRA